MQSNIYSWRIRDVRMHHGRKKKWRNLTWKMTETQALAWASRHGFEIQRIEGSHELLRAPSREAERTRLDAAPDVLPAV